jgi:hypothetical protein
MKKLREILNNLIQDCQERREGGEVSYLQCELWNA